MIDQNSLRKYVIFNFLIKCAINCERFIMTMFFNDTYGLEQYNYILKDLEPKNGPLK